MAKIPRYPGNLKAFASEALGTERTVFGDTAQSDLLADNITTDFLRGWGIVGVNENPTKQDFNGLAFTLGQLLAYLHQMGIAEWDDEQEYPEHGICAANGALYRSLSDGNIGNDPTTDAVNWKYLLSADDLKYDNTASGLAATTGQGAIDELADSYTSYDSLTGGGSLTSNKRFHITDSLTYTLPDTSGIAVGASVVVTKAVGDSPTVDTFGTEQIVTEAGSVASITLTASTENVFVWDGSNWQAASEQHSEQLGWNQTWQNVTASRSSGVTYNNTSGRPIFISVQGDQTAVEIIVDGEYVVLNEAGTDYGVAIVPNGSTYSVTVNSLLNWMELR